MSEPKTNLDSRGSTIYPDDWKSRPMSYLDIEELTRTEDLPPAKGEEPPELKRPAPVSDTELISRLREVVREVNRLCLIAQKRGIELELTTLFLRAGENENDRIFLRSAYRKTPI